MNDDTPHILFELSSQSAMFRALHPAYGGKILSLDELVPTPSEEERLAYLEERLPEEAKDQAADFLSALEELRSAPLAGSDDLEYAFSLLPPSPKNRALKSLLSFYLDSPLSRDRTAGLLALAENWMGGGAAPAPGNWRVVPDPARPEGLADFTKALARAKGVTSAFLVESWAISPPKAEARRSAQFPLSAPQSLEMAARLCGRKAPTALVFQGTEAERTWLTFALRARGLRVRDFHETPPSTSPLPTSHGSLMLTALRKLELPPAEKLQLSHLLCQSGAPLWDETAWNRGLARLTESGKISEKEQALLAALRPFGADERAREEENPDVWLLPFPAVDLPEPFSVVVHADTQALPRPKTSPLLRESEREWLAAAGFHLPRASMLQAQGRHAWSHWAGRAGKRRWVFGSDGPGRALKLPKKIAAPRADEPPPAENRDLLLSATQFETYAKCPSRYWYGHRLRLRRTDRDGSGYPLILGQLVHKALENALLENREIHDEQRWIESLPDAFSRALLEEAPEIHTESRLAAELRGPFFELLRRVPSLEAQLRATVGEGFQPLALERDFSFEWRGLTVRGKIDRIDQGPNGELLILDYKTGAVDFSPGHIAQGKSFQPLLYLLAVEHLYGKRAAGMLFYDLKEAEIRRGLLREEAFAPEIKKSITRGHVLGEEAFGRIVDAGTEQLTQLASRIGAGDFEPTPAADVCGRCDFVAVCREAVGYG